MSEDRMHTISALEANEKLTREKGECVLIDVRTPAEFKSVHAIHAQNIPLQSVAEGLTQSPALKDKRLICICQKGARGENAANILLRNGARHVYNVAGGTEAWEQSGLPVTRGGSVISLERQVRIAAGSLVALGVLLGYLVNPYASLLALFVGCGLVFSGITNTCGMALLLARCPWNSK